MEKQFVFRVFISVNNLEPRGVPWWGRAPCLSRSFLAALPEVARRPCVVLSLTAGAPTTVRSPCVLTEGDREKGREGERERGRRGEREREFDKQLGPSNAPWKLD